MTLPEMFRCGPLADPAQIADMWIAEAVILSLAGEKEASESALATVRLPPERGIATSFGARREGHL